jgi:hypothetical protein
MPGSTVIIRDKGMTHHYNGSVSREKHCNPVIGDSSRVNFGCQWHYEDAVYCKRRQSNCKPTKNEASHKRDELRFPSTTTI